MLDSIKKAIKENFKFNVESHLSRGEAFAKDKILYVDQEDDDWYVFGDITGFAYGSFADKEKAQAYADELNNNRKNLENI